MNFKILSDKFEIFLFVLSIIVGEKLFYLVNWDAINSNGLFNIYDLGILLIIIWGIFVLLKYRHIKIKKYNYLWIVAFILILIVISSIQSNKLYGQPISMGLRPQRFFLILYLAYFPLLKVLYGNKEFYSKIQNILFIIGGVELFLFIMQYFLYGKINFLHVPISERFNDTRLSFASSLLTILPFFVINNIINKYKTKVNLAFLIAIIFYNMVVTKGRLSSIALLISIVIILLIQRRSLNIKIILVTFGMSAIIIGSLAVPIFQSYLQVFNNDYISKDQNSIIRREGKKFYLSQIKKSPVLGRGFINTLDKNAYSHSGIEQNYFFVDNGVTAFYFFYGLIGIAWLAAFAIMLFVFGIKNYLYNSNYTLLGWFLYNVLIAQNIIPFYWYWGPLFMVIMISLGEFDLKKDINKIEKSKDLHLGEI